MSRIALAFTGAALVLALGSAVANDRDDRDRGKGGHDELSGVKAELAALKQRVRRLEGDLKPHELVGTYRMAYLQVAIGENAMNGLANHLEHNVWGGTLTLSSNGTASFSGREVGFAAGLPGPTAREERLNDPDQFTGTWTYTGGAIVITLVGDNGQPENVNFVGGAGGRMFFTVDANPLDGTTTLILISKDL
jgi:hypothetical protein